MVSLLPNNVQERVMDLLNRGDFVGAKAIYDQWHSSHSLSPWNARKDDDDVRRAV